MDENAKKQRTIFIVRMVLFTIFACVIPFIFIAWRYDIFRVKDSTSPRVSITGWGIVAIIILFFFIKYVIHALKIAVPFSFALQIINGIVKVILPLLILYFVVSAIANSIAIFKTSLLFTIICELIAIPINPLPKYMHDKHIEYAGGLVDMAIDKWKNKGGN